jgi:hypothetical protein
LSLSDKFLDEGLQFWRSRTSRKLSREDVRQTVENLCGFFAVLRDWDAAERQGKKDRLIEGGVSAESVND